LGSIFKNVEIEDMPGKTADQFWAEFTSLATRVHGRPHGAVKRAIRESFELYIKKYSEKK
jgi:hypothetical protein